MAVFSNRPFRFEKGFASFATLRFDFIEVSYEASEPPVKQQNEVSTIIGKTSHVKGSFISA